VTFREAATWLGVPEDDDVAYLLAVPPFRKAVTFVAKGQHQYVFNDPYAGGVLEKFNIPLNQNGDLDIQWLRNTAINCQQDR
jgi:hypothetical protein